MLVLISQLSFSQRISVLTCDKGSEIYSTFGHSAIRVVDTSKNTDWVYNYGLFDFADPNFIPKFCMGKLDYMVGKELYSDFLTQYEYQKRGVSEQVLNLTQIQKDSLITFLEWNILPENKMYRYDFLFNNCATKIVDIIEKNCKGISMSYYQDENPLSFRQLIHKYAHLSVPFIDWGMDVAIGTPTDVKATPRQYCFLPDYVSKSLNLSNNLSLNQRLVLTENTILPSYSYSNYDSIFTPVLFACILFCLMFYFKGIDSIWNRLLQFLFFFILGIGGLVIGFEWFFTEHSVTKFNFNLLWLNPLSLIYSIFILFDIKVLFRVQLKKFIGLSAFLALIAYFVTGQCFHKASYIIIVLIIILAAMDVKIVRKNNMIILNN